MKIMSRGESPSVKKSIVRNAIKATAKHTARGTAAKAKRKPLRTTTLLGLGCLVGGVAGWALGRASA
jgi:hypothetical protein